jgi:hypothetical protein
VLSIDSPEVKEWLAANQKLQSEDYTLTAQQGAVNIKIMRSHTRHGGGRSVHAFINRRSGDVLKPEGLHKPAKHARGNLFDEHKGMSMMGEYGPAYLR